MFLITHLPFSQISWSLSCCPSIFFKIDRILIEISTNERPASYFSQPIRSSFAIRRQPFKSEEQICLLGVMTRHYHQLCQQMLWRDIIINSVSKCTLLHSALLPCLKNQQDSSKCFPVFFPNPWSVSDQCPESVSADLIKAQLVCVLCTCLNVL